MMVTATTFSESELDALEDRIAAANESMVAAFLPLVPSKSALNFPNMHVLNHLRFWIEEFGAPCH
jgi:hypothetical protein